MVNFLNSLAGWLEGLVGMSVTAAWAAAVIALLWLVLRRRAPRWVCALLWLVVFARLLVPVSFRSPVSAVPSAVAEIQLPDGAGPAPTLPQPGETVPAVPTGPATAEPAVSPAPGPVTSAAPAEPLPSGEPVISTDPVGPVPDPVAAPAFTWRTALAAVWLLGAAAMMGYALFSYLRLRRTVYDAVRTEPGVWEHPTLRSPFLLGAGRPRIYLPTGLTGDTRAFVLAHERAHIRRGDWLVKPLCWLALSLHWFNPMAWVAFALMGADMEAACDQAVLRRLGEGVKADYSAALLTLAMGRRRVPAPCPLAFGEGSAKGRIKSVLSYRRPAFWVVLLAVLAAIAAAVCLLTDPVAAGKHDPLPLRESPLAGNVFEGGAAVRWDGKLVAWGDLAWDGSTAEDPLVLAENVAAVYSYSSLTDLLYIDRAGGLWVVGNGWLAGENAADRSSVTYIMDDVVYVCAHPSYAFAIKSDGTLWTWGYNGQLPGEDGPRDGYYGPVQIMEDVIDAAICETRGGSVVKRDGTLWLWNEEDPTPRQVGEGVRAVFDRQLLLGTDGTLYGCPVDLDKLPEVGLVPILTDVVRVCRPTDLCGIRGAIRSDGTLWVWSAQTGTNDYTIRDEPRQVMDGVADMVSSREETYILKTDGTLLRLDNGAIPAGEAPTGEEPIIPDFSAAGEMPFKGQGWESGFDEPAPSASEPAEPKPDLTLRESSIAAGGDRGTDIWVIRADDTLITWGEAESGEAIPLNDPLEVMEHVAAVSLSYLATTLCIDRQGRLWTVGESGLESDGGFDRYRVSYITDNVVYARFFAGVGYALKADRTLWMWGKDPVLPGERREGYMAPEKVMDDVIDMQITLQGGLCVVKSDYTVWAWNYFNLEPLKLCEGVRELGGSSVLGVDGVRYRWDPGAYNQPVTLGAPVEDKPGGNSMGYRLEDGDLWAYAEDGREPRLVASDVAEMTYNEAEYIILKRDGTLLRVAIEPGEYLEFPYDGVVETLPIKGQGWAAAPTEVE